MLPRMPFIDLRLGNPWEYQKFFRLVGQPRSKKILHTPRFNQYVSVGPVEVFLEPS